MEIKDLFRFKSKKERAKEAEAYQNRIFHLGEGHQALALDRMKQLIEEPKTDQELMYIYICVKDLITKTDEEERAETLKNWYDTTYLYPGDKLRAIRLAELDTRTPDLACYPTAEQVRAELAEGDMSFRIEIP